MDPQTIQSWGSLLASFAALFSVGYTVWKGGLTRERPLKLILMSHGSVMSYIKDIEDDIRASFQELRLQKRNLALYIIFGLFFVLVLILMSISMNYAMTNTFSDSNLRLLHLIPQGLIALVVINGILLSSHSVTSKDTRLALRFFFFNVLLPVSVLVIFLFPCFLVLSLPNLAQQVEHSYLLDLLKKLLEYTVISYFSEIILLLIPSKFSKRYVILSNESEVIGLAFGLYWTFFFSLIITLSLSQLMLHFASISGLPDKKLIYSAVVIAIAGILILWYLVLSIKHTATHFLWKVRLSSFAGCLPHLIVKIKSGDIFFGQLYDPFDGKVLILRNAKLVIHEGQRVDKTLEDIVSHDVAQHKRADYISVPWNEIETLQIVEEGLYMTSSAKKEKDSSERPEEKAPCTGVDKAQNNTSKENEK